MMNNDEDENCLLCWTGPWNVGRYLIPLFRDLRHDDFGGILCAMLALTLCHVLVYLESTEDVTYSVGRLVGGRLCVASSTCAVRMRFALSGDVSRS